jgi:tetratricopeptide (TPR) repeat protein
MADRVPPPMSLALTTLRTARGWTQRRLAAAAGSYGSVICELEAGRSRHLRRDALDRLAALMGYGAEEVDLALLYAAGLLSGGGEDRSTPVDPPADEARRIGQTAAWVGLVEAGRMRARLGRLVRARRAAAARAAAAERWEELRRHSPARRLQLVAARPDCQAWALAERLCDESERAAAESPPQAEALARLALRRAELAPGGARWRSCLLGYATAFLGNALRVAGDLPAAEAAFAAARRLWRAGGRAARGPLAEWRLPDLEASLRRDLRQFDAALALLRRALAAAPAAARGRILLKQASTLEQAGRFAAALAALDEAAPLVAASDDRRVQMGVQFNRLVNLCHLGRFGDAQAALPALRRLIPRKGADALRWRWLAARVAAGQGRREEARRAFARLRRQFSQRRLGYDVALVSLELAVLDLEAGRPAAVAALAEEMVWLFASRRVHREALAALRLFVEAARAGSATVELARRVLGFLEAARRDPRLRFEEAERLQQPGAGPAAGASAAADRTAPGSGPGSGAPAPARRPGRREG